MKNSFRYLLLIGFCFFYFFQTAHAEDKSFVIKAEEISRYDNILKAQGHVIVRAENYELHSDFLEGNLDTNLLTINGAITLQTKEGQLIGADQLILESTLDYWEGDQISFLQKTPDQITILSQHAKKDKGRYNFEDTLVTLCPVCDKDGNPTPPLWTMSAEKITIDPDHNTNRFHSVIFKTYGIPFFYTPYFSTVYNDRLPKSGLLAPSYGNHNGELGNYYIQPLYLSIARDKDISLIPIWSGNNASLLRGQYRQDFLTSQLQLDATFANQQEQQIEQKPYHLRFNYQAEFSENWRFQSEGHKSNSDHFLHDYGLSPSSFSAIGSSPNHYINQLDLEWLSGRHYALFEAEKSTDLRRIPTALVSFDQIDKKPSLYVDFQGHAENFYDRWSFEGTLMRRDYNLSNRKTDRFSGNLDYDLSFSFGHASVIPRFGVRMDSWRDASDGVEESAGQSRFIPWGSLQLSQNWPWIFNRHVVFFEPSIGVYQAPRDVDNDLISIEDGLIFIPEEASFFAGNRIKGDDLFESGQRLSAGLKTSIITETGGQLSIFAGKSKRTGEDPMLLAKSGIDQGESPAFYAVTIASDSLIDASWRVEENISQRAHIALNHPIFSLGTSYQSSKEIPRRNINQSEFLNTSASLKLKAWTVKTAAEYNLLRQDNSSPDELSASLHYQGACFFTEISFLKNTLDDEKSYMFSFSLGNIGKR